MANEPKQLTLTSDDLKALITAAVAAAKEPNELERLELEEKRAQKDVQRAQIEEEQRLRAETGLQQLAIAENKRSIQKICTHKHKQGATHCVYVTDDRGGYVLCQKCQAVVRPGPAPVKNNIGAIYDTPLFNT